MKKDLEIEVIVSLDNNIGNLLFNFYDEDEVVGYVNVDSRGFLLWDLMDERYNNKILEFASKIYGDRLTNSVEKQLKGFSEDINRWKRAKYIVHTLHLNVKSQTELELEQTGEIHI